jgi:hypothetical protein
MALGELSGCSSAAGVKEGYYRIGHSSAQAALRYPHATTSRDVAIASGISKLIRRERTGGDGALDPA